ncbi:MAG TPA: S24 family peptidase [Planctomycetota bacterium]|nr:S24 family peptidase [Planctomycetota bacterium]
MRRGIAADPDTMRRLLRASGELRLVVLGTSMAPTIRPGDSVVMRPLDGAPRVGDVVVYARGGRLWCHRVLLPGRATITKGDARGRPDPPVATADLIGRAIALQRGSRIIELHGLGSRLAGLALNLSAPAAALGRRLARRIGVAPAPERPARHLLVAGFDVEVTGPRRLLLPVPAKRGRPSIRPDFRIDLELRQGATTGGRFGLVESGRRGRFRLTAPAAVAHFDMADRHCRAEVVHGAEDAGVTAVLRAAGLLMVAAGGGLALHASAVRHGGRAYLFSGPSGAGKSTAMRRACEAGAEPLADDLVLLRRDGSGGTGDPAGGRGDRWLAWGPPTEPNLAEHVGQDRRGTPVAALLVPARGEELDVRPLSAAGWTVLAGTFPPAPGAPGDQGTLELLAELAEGLPRRLVFFADRPGALAELFRRLEEGA